MDKNSHKDKNQRQDNVHKKISREAIFMGENYPWEIWSVEREYGVIHFGKKSVILFDIQEYAQIKYI